MKGPASRMPNESSDYRLLVEGSSDQHAIIHLMKRHDYKWEDGSTQRPYVQSYDGLPNLPRAITAAKAKSRLGIVVDADESPAARWQELTRWLAPIVQRVPSEPAKEGLVLEGVVPDTWVGVWMMPDNCVRGALEDLVQELLPPDDPCWALAQEQARTAMGRYGRNCSFGFALKSQLHTWLAWQEEPGMSFGQALNTKLLKHDTERACQFKEWFLKLFPTRPAAA